MNVKQLGQVFTPEKVVDNMLSLRTREGRILEPSCGDGAFSNKLKCIAIEVDPKVCPDYALNIDFFNYSINEKFDTIIGNPPYVGFKAISDETKQKLDLNYFDNRTNLYTFFIDKCVKHLSPGGELIFITPRDFIKLTSCINLNKKLFELGTFTHFYDLGDSDIFGEFVPNCAIWRYELNNFNRSTVTNQGTSTATCLAGQILFLNKAYSVPLSDLFSVKVGAVSGMDEVFTHEDGNMDFVCSYTAQTGLTKRMHYNVSNEWLERHKNALRARKIKKFNDTNWHTWGRGFYESNEKRIYVNCKTRNPKPFFTHPCNNYDGAVLALFLRDQGMDHVRLCEQLNEVDWQDLGFVCDGRYLFGQRSLEQTMLPDTFTH